MKKTPARKPARTNPEERIEVSIEQSQWAGPLPSPDALAYFNEIVDNGAERIVSAWEKESEHRRELENKGMKLAYSDLRIGKVFALIFVLSALGLSGFCAYVGDEWLGSIIGAGTIASVVWAFTQTLHSK